MCTSISEGTAAPVIRDFVKMEAARSSETSVLLYQSSGFGGLVVSMLASGSRVRGFEPGRSRWIFRVSE